MKMSVLLESTCGTLTMENLEESIQALVKAGILSDTELFIPASLDVPITGVISTEILLDNHPNVDRTCNKVDGECACVLSLAVAKPSADETSSDLELFNHAFSKLVAGNETGKDVSIALDMSFSCKKGSNMATVFLECFGDGSSEVDANKQFMKWPLLEEKNIVDSLLQQVWEIATHSNKIIMLLRYHDDHHGASRWFILPQHLAAKGKTLLDEFHCACDTLCETRYANIGVHVLQSEYLVKHAQGGGIVSAFGDLEVVVLVCEENSYSLFYKPMDANAELLSENSNKRLFVPHSDTQEPQQKRMEHTPTKHINSKVNSPVMRLMLCDIYCWGY
jgi:hypothetical protein